MLLVAAGLALAPMAVISLVTFPLVVVSVGMLAAATLAPKPVSPRSAPSTGVVVGLVATFLAASMAALVFHQDPRSVSTPTSGAMSSDVITWAEVTISLACTVVALIVGGFGMRPGDVPDRSLPPRPSL